MIVNHPVLAAIGARHGGKSAAQVAIAFHVARGIPTFPKSINPERILHNLESADIKLTADVSGPTLTVPAS